MVDYQTICVERNEQDGVARVMMNRPEKRNAINKPMIVEMMDAFSRLEEDDEIRVIIFGGNGSCFSAGHDLSPLEEYPDSCDGRIRFERKYYFDEIMAMRNLRKPIIAQVHSHCIAAAMVLAMVCDIVIVSEDARFSDPVVRMGANSQEVMILPWVVGEKKAKELLFTGDAITAEQALELGMVNRVVPREQLEQSAYELGKRIALMPPIAISLVKESINNTLDMMGYTNAMKMHFASHLLSHSTEEAQSGMAKSKRGDLKDYFAKRDQSFGS